MQTLTAERLWSLPRVGPPVAAGEDLVVPVTTYDVAENRGWTRLHLVELADGHTRPITAPRSDATRPVVDTAGRRIAFLRRVEDRPQCHVLDLAGGEAECVTSLPLGVLAVKWLPDGSGLVIVAPVLRGFLGVDATREELARRERSKVAVHVTEDAIYRYWDQWLDTGEVPHIFTLDLASGTFTDLTPAEERWWRWSNTADPTADFDVAPDGTEVVFVADRSDPPHRDIRWNLYRVGLTGEGAPELLTAGSTGHAHRPRYSADGSTLVYGMQRIPDFYADRIRLVALDRVTGEHRVLTEDWDRSAADWIVDGDRILFAAEDRGRRPLWSLPLTGGTPHRLAEDGTLAAPVAVGDALFALGHGLLRPPEVVRVAEDGVTPVTSFTTEAVAELDLGRIEEIEIQGADGDEVQVWLLHPPRPVGDPPPLVQLVHGGPHGSFGDSWHWRWNVAVFAAPGYLVAMVNFHGSTGFGQDFAASIHGRWGDQPLIDVEAATDHLLEVGLVDGARMAVAGGSYGGYLTAWITTQTNRYACAVAHAAVTDLPGMYASDITMGRARAYGAEIWEDRTKVERWSPHAYAAGYATPTLVVHGERDYRVPVGQGLELYGVLRAKGVEARLVYYPDENHWILRPANSIHWYGEVFEWLNRYLR